MATNRKTEAELEGFGPWLEQFALRKRTKEIYLRSVAQMLSEIKQLTEYEINLFLKDHQRPYYKKAILYYLKFKGIKDFELIRIRVQPPKPQDRPEHKGWMEVLNKIRTSGNAFADLYWTGIVLYYTGARINEVLCLALKHLDRKESRIIFEKTGRSIKKVQDMPVPSDVLDELLKYLTHEKGLLSEDRCFYTKYSNIQYAYNQYRAEIDRLVSIKTLSVEEGKLMKKSHTFRRSWTDMMDVVTGGDIVAVSDARRDEDIRTTIRYLETRKREKRAAEAKRKLLEALEK